MEATLTNMRALLRRKKKVDQTDHHLAILRILAGQAPGYDAFPNATCFHCVGYDDHKFVHGVLEDLANAGLAVSYVYDVVTKHPHEVLAAMSPEEREPFLEVWEHDVVPHDGEDPENGYSTVPRLAKEGSLPEAETEEVPGGYEITDAGRELLAKLGEETSG